VRVQSGNAGEAVEVSIVKGQNLVNAVDHHRGDKPGIV
jgi:hypothetical protein